MAFAQVVAFRRREVLKYILPGRYPPAMKHALHRVTEFLNSETILSFQIFSKQLEQSDVVICFGLLNEPQASHSQHQFILINYVDRSKKSYIPAQSGPVGELWATSLVSGVGKEFFPMLACNGLVKNSCVVKPSLSNSEYCRQELGISALRRYFASYARNDFRPRQIY